MSVCDRHHRRPPGRARRGWALISLTGLALLAAAPAARATSIGEKIVLRCTHGQSLGGFSQADYKQALEDLSSTTEEYSPCGAEIREAEQAAAAHLGTQAGGGAEAPAVALAASPAELHSLARARRQGSGPVKVGGEVIHPGVVHANIASAFSTLPAPLLAVLALMLACALGLAGFLLRKRVRGRPHN